MIDDTAEEHDDFISKHGPDTHIIGTFEAHAWRTLRSTSSQMEIYDTTLNL